MTLEPIAVRRLVAALGAVLLLACAARAQEGRPRAEKLSEYVNQFTSCNAGAHLDNLAIHLKNEQAVTGYVRIYGPGGPDDGFGERAVRATRDYLIDTRGVEESRLRVVYGGRYKNLNELLTEVWVVPEGAEPPPASKYKPDLEFEGRFAELAVWDGPEGGEGWASSAEVAMVGLSDMMRKRADARAYFVAYQTDENAPGAWRREAGQLVESLGRHGVAAERAKVIFGGYANEENVNVWILPPDAPPPAKQRRERRPQRSVQVASLDGFQLKYYERWGFKGFADVLKADGQLTGCLVVRLAPARPKDADPEAPAHPDEPPDVDVMQLVEKWKAELKKGGVGEHRLIVMVAPTREHQSGGELETWVVPPGAPLPDPSADERQGVEEVGEENPEGNPKEF